MSGPAVLAGPFFFNLRSPSGPAHHPCGKLQFPVQVPGPLPQMTPSDFFSTERNPAPDGAVLVPLKAADGVSLRAARFPAAAGVPFRGTVCLFQGRGEFIEKYFEMVRDLTGRGFDVAALDWRGQGGSQRLVRGRGGHVGSFAAFQRDLDIFMEWLVRPDCRPPHFALAHSTGGAIVLEAARRRTTWWDRIVLSAPLVALPGFGGHSAARGLGGVLCLIGLGRMPAGRGTGRAGYRGAFEGNVLTSDRSRFERIAEIERAAPHLTIDAPTLGWVHAAHRAMELFSDPSRISEIRTPTLFVTAGEDRVVSTRASEVLASRMRTASVVTLPGARHEIMMERDPLRDAFLAAFDAFVPGTPAF
jgi:lysophospholipase